MLVTYLRDREEPCPACRYNLRGLTGEACPECGEPLRLRVGLVNPKLAAYFTLLCAAACGAGGSGLMLLLVLAQAPGDWLVEQLAGWVLMAMAVVTWTMVATTLRCARRLRRLGAWSRWSWAVAAWAIVLAFSVVFIVCFDD